MALPHPKWNEGKGMFTRQGSSWRCKIPWNGLGINPAGEMQGIPTILPWTPSVVSHLPLQLCLRSPGPPGRIEFTQDPSWESLMDLLPNPTDTGPFAANSGWGVGFEGRGFGIRHCLQEQPSSCQREFYSPFPADFQHFNGIFFFPSQHISSLSPNLWFSRRGFGAASSVT